MIPWSLGSSLDKLANISINPLNLVMYLHEAPCKKLLVEVCNLLSEESVVISIAFLEEDRN